MMSVTLSATRNLWSALPVIACREGLFTKLGLDVQINYVASASQALSALAAGQANFATVVPVDLAAATLAGDSNLRLVATSCTAANNAIVARRSFDVYCPEDLKGKQIGLLAGTSSESFVEHFLTKNHINGDDVRFVSMTRPELEAALAAGWADAVSVWQPITLELTRALGEDETTLFEDSSFLGHMNIAVRGTSMLRHGEVSRKFLRGLKDAGQYLRDTPFEAQAIMADELGLARDVVEALWSRYDFTLKLDMDLLERTIVDEAAWIAPRRGYPGRLSAADGRRLLAPELLRSLD